MVNLSSSHIHKLAHFNDPNKWVTHLDDPNWLADHNGSSFCPRFDNFQANRLGWPERKICISDERSSLIIEMNKVMRKLADKENRMDRETRGNERRERMYGKLKRKRKSGNLFIMRISFYWFSSIFIDFLLMHLFRSFYFNKIFLVIFYHFSLKFFYLEYLSKKVILKLLKVFW